VGGLTLAAAACGKAPDTPGSGSTTSAGATTKYTACMVTDVGGIDDRSFNASAWAGLQAAQKAQSTIEPKNTSSTAEADYEPNLRQYVSQKCNFILSVGGLMGEVTGKVAKETPAQQFGIVDSGPAAGVPNLFPMQFATEQAAFMAGYLAAGYSKSGKVGTYGGLKIPPVTVFMDGFADGVAHYNKVKGKNVAVLGWDKAKQNGTFAESFTAQDKGKELTNTLVAQGADVIMPVAGGTGLGTAAVAQGAPDKLAVIWVDLDGCKSAAQYCSVFMTTVMKNITGAVAEATTKGAKGEPLTANPGYLGTLANEGVSLAPYNQFESKIDPALKAEVDKLKADIIAGTVPVTSVNSPKK
jgi:basic membrane protein A